MKKFLCLTIAALMILGSTACIETEDGKGQEPDSKINRARQTESGEEHIWLTDVSHQYPLGADCELRFAAENEGRVFCAGVSGESPMLCYFDIRTENGLNISQPQPVSLPQEAEDERYIYGLAAGEDDSFYLLMGQLPDMYTYVEGSGENRFNEDYQGLYSILKLDSEGGRLGKISFQLPPQEGVLGVKCLYGLVCSDDGGLVVWGSSEVSLIDFDSGLVRRNILEANSVDTVSKYHGHAAVLCGINTEGRCSLVNKSDGTLMDVNGSGAVYSSVSSCISCGGRLLVNDWQSLAEYDPELGTYTPLFRWLDCGGIDGGSVKQVPELDDNLFLVSYWHHASISLLSRSYRPDSRQVLELACYPGISRSMAAIIGQFNTSNPAYRINYTEYPAESLDKLRALLSSSSAPDIVLSDGSIDLSSDMFADLYPLLDQAVGLSREDFVPGLLGALETDGKLKELWTSFIFNTIISASGDRQSGGLDAYEALARERGCSVFEGWVTGEELLKWVATVSTGEFVDYSTGSCNFVDPGFARMLEWCRAMPVTATDERAAILYPIYIENPALIRSQAEYLGGSLEYVGFPVESGSGSYLGCGFQASLSAPALGDTAGAWAFIRFAIEKTGEMNIGADDSISTFSCLIKPLRLSLEQSLGKTEAEKFISAISGSRALKQQDLRLRRLIIDSSAAYLAGNKSLEDTVELIQDKASIFVAEQRG